ncbi:hypothetical protein [Streptomyces sp. ISL-100]|uniref:hypothetical protein n=1 Tax=Streptomyces sp. ISL-100 TaxID=2819173 RepID=UPI001BEB3C71|nr:hypothetical protein [Streptomyces sp. ISL-100]MBT2397466.1 hypothetical protein [Streptomyces sp. ISL-100]
MAVVMTLVWPEITPELYDAARARVRWEEEPPDGLVLHTAWFAGDGFHVLDIWESEDLFPAFVAARIEPVLKGELGVKSDPQVEFFPLHRRFVASGVSGGA